MDEFMTTSISISGVFPVLPTIFDNRGEIDLVSMRNVLEYVISAGADGVVFPGLASEYDLLTDDERLELTKLLGGWINQRVAFIVGASASTPEGAAGFAQVGADAGANAAMIMTPHTFARDPKLMAQFYETAGDCSGIPIMLQNAPKPMGIGLSVKQVAELALQVDQITYVKEETPPAGQRISGLRAHPSLNLDGVFGGAGGRHLLDEMNRGADGTMPACEITEIHVDMVKAYGEGNRLFARELFERSLPLLNMQATFRWRLTKELLLRRGLISSTFVRAHGPELDKHDHEELDAILARITDLTHISL